MKVHELISWLQAFEDQDAVVKVLHCEGGHGVYAQGGVTQAVTFDHELHTDYTDFRDNQFARSQPWWNERTLLLGLDEN